jgi:hypothetical protein
MKRKKEDPEKVKARVKRYLDTHSQLLITGLSEDIKQSFINLEGLEGLSHSKKLIELIEFWNKQSSKEERIKSVSNINPLGVKIIPKSTRAKDIDSDFLEFLYQFKMNNQTKSGLRRRGTMIREELYQKPKYKKSFLRICERLPIKISKSFKEMFLQGYFSIPDSEMQEIAEEKNLNSMILLLFRRLEFMYKENPLEEARKTLR